MDPEIRAARMFAEEDICAYIQNFVTAAKYLQHKNDLALSGSALTCILVFLYRNVICLRLKYLTISAALHLQKPLTNRHVGVINAFTLQQLWSNLTVMLDQITSDAQMEIPLSLSALEADVRYVEECDLALYALCALGARSSSQPRAYEAENEKSREGCPLSVITRLENLLDSLLRIEDWVAALSPLQAR